MSKKEKVTIKFWDIAKGDYDFQNHYYVCEYGDVRELFSGMDATLEVVCDIEPHFYIGDKRIG